MAWLKARLDSRAGCSIQSLSLLTDHVSVVFGTDLKAYSWREIWKPPVSSFHLLSDSIGIFNPWPSTCTGSINSQEETQLFLNWGQGSPIEGELFLLVGGQSLPQAKVLLLFTLDGRMKQDMNWRAGALSAIILVLFQWRKNRAYKESSQLLEYSTF